MNINKLPIKQRKNILNHDTDACIAHYMELAEEIGGLKYNYAAYIFNRLYNIDVTQFEWWQELN